MFKNYDAKTNTLTLLSKEESVEKGKSRAFIVTIADSEAEADAIKKGDIVKFNISPILAENEGVAIEHMKNLGKIVISIVPLELLEMQLNLLYQLAESKKVELVREQLFNVQKN